MPRPPSSKKGEPPANTRPSAGKSPGSKWKYSGGGHGDAATGHGCKERALTKRARYRAEENGMTDSTNNSEPSDMSRRRDAYTGQGTAVGRPAHERKWRRGKGPQKIWPEQQRSTADAQGARNTTHAETHAAEQTPERRRGRDAKRRPDTKQTHARRRKTERENDARARGRRRDDKTNAQGGRGARRTEQQADATTGRQPAYGKQRTHCAAERGNEHKQRDTKGRGRKRRNEKKGRRAYILTEGIRDKLDSTFVTAPDPSLRSCRLTTHALAKGEPSKTRSISQCRFPRR